ncbi:MAG: hypothetical protein QXU98_05595 [Candidatus Parvarchaeota archaeon]
MNYDMTRRNGMNNLSRLSVSLILLELFLLLIQFLIGMWMNLFAVFPSFGPSDFMYGMMQVMFSVLELMIHMMMGIFIGIISLIIFFTFAMKGDNALSSLSALASILILVAGIGGLEFMFSGFVNNIFSFIMSLGFIFTVAAYFLILYLILNKK